MFALLFISFYIILARSIFSVSPIWADEMPRFMLICTVFISIPYLTSSKTLLVVNLTEILFGKKKKINSITMLIGDFILLALLIYMIFPSGELMIRNMLTFSPALRIPMAYMYGFIPASFALSAIATIKNIAEQLLVDRNKGKMEVN